MNFYVVNIGKNNMKIKLDKTILKALLIRSIMFE